MKNVERDVVLNRVMKELGLKEKIIVAIFKKIFYYVYRKGVADCFNYYNKWYVFLCLTMIH